MLSLKHKTHIFSKMTTIAFQIRARLQNVLIIYCPRDYEWCFDVEDPLTGERCKVLFKGTDCQTLPHDDPTEQCVNFYKHWTRSNRVASIKLYYSSPMYYEQKNGRWRDFAYFKCEGLKVNNIHFLKNFHVMDVDGVIYNGVVGVVTNWCANNPNLEEAVKITNLQTRFKIVTNRNIV